MIRNSDSRAKAKPLHIKKGDQVVVLSGESKSDQPREVLSVDREAGRVIVKGVNMRWSHERPSQKNPEGGRNQREHPIDASKVLLYSEKAKAGTRTRIEIVDDKRVRVGVKCGTRFD
ncbi:MAG: 50S ribosomal protein L24 [Planctomycetota bacterium]